MGIFHNNGQAGLPQNEELAMQYFHRAADHPLNPFPLAMNVVGKDLPWYVLLIWNVIY